VVAVVLQVYSAWRYGKSSLEERWECLGGLPIGIRTTAEDWGTTGKLW
jgi:hypothetical protein